MKPRNVSDEAWQAAVATAKEDPHRLARLVRSGRVRRVPGERALPLPPPPPRVNTAIRPNRKNRKKGRR